MKPGASRTKDLSSVVLPVPLRPISAIFSPRDTLAARLRTLTGAGILQRRKYCEHPARFEYHLTDAGRDLYPVIVTLMRWGDKYLAGQDGPPLVLRHHCGHRLTAEVVCQACGEPLHARDATPVRA